MATDWRTPETDALVDAILRLEDADEAGRFLRDLCTLGELHDLAQRWAVVRLLDEGMHYAEISRQDRREHGDDHPHRVLAASRRGRLPADAGARPRRGRRARCAARGTRSMRERLRLAVPNKGRLVEPTLALLHDAGLVFEEHDRSLVARVQNHPLDILFVRTGDVVEFVGDGVADIGVTGGDLLAETGAELPVVCMLGYGRCRLAAAVPADSPFEAIGDLAGVRVATSHPNVARRFFATQSLAVDVVPLSGAVEVAPRLGLADAIVDLVSTGSTLAMNGLRAIGDILASEAILVANPTTTRERADELGAIVTMVGSVIAARGRKYLMMNAPATHLGELESLLPGLESPSVIPLAHAGMIAIHSVVGADEVWGLLPRLKAAGASGILVLPIEKILP